MLVVACSHVHCATALRALISSIDATLDLAKLEERIPKEQTETIDLADLARSVVETCEGQVRVTAEPSEFSPEGKQTIEFDAIVRIDTPGEADYYRNGGILQYVLRSLV